MDKKIKLLIMKPIKKNILNIILSIILVIFSYFIPLKRVFFVLMCIIILVGVVLNTLNDGIILLLETKIKFIEGGKNGK